MAHCNEVKELKHVNMANMNFHYGIVMQCYPSYDQQQIIQFNGYQARFLYNQLVISNKLVYRWKRWQSNSYWFNQFDVLILNKFNWRYYFNACQFNPFIWHLGFYHQMILKSKNKNWPQYFPWLNEQYHGKKQLDSLNLPNQKQNYQKAWDMFQKGIGGIPTLKQRNKFQYHQKYQTSTVYQSKKAINLFTGSIKFIDAHHLKVPKIGKIRVKGSIKRLFDLSKHHDIRIGTVTIQHLPSGKYTISLQLGAMYPFVNIERQYQHTIKRCKMYGLDLNLENFLTDTDGQKVANPQYYRHALKKLKKLQHQLSRKCRLNEKHHHKLSQAKNYQKQRIQVAKLHEHIHWQRQNFLNNLSTKIIKSHDFIVSENLLSKNMQKNHALAMSISDIGWRTFISMLESKANLYNKVYLKVDPKFTTQICHTCGFRMGTCHTHKLQLKDRQWTCPSCGTHHIRDYNAAINILVKGINQYYQQQTLTPQILKEIKQNLVDQLQVAPKLVQLSSPQLTR